LYCPIDLDSKMVIMIIDDEKKPLSVGVVQFKLSIYAGILFKGII
jgi:hypothetical protein